MGAWPRRIRTQRNFELQREGRRALDRDRRLFQPLNEHVSASIPLWKS